MLTLFTFSNSILPISNATIMNFKDLIGIGKLQALLVGENTSIFRNYAIRLASPLCDSLLRFKVDF